MMRTHKFVNLLKPLFVLSFAVAALTNCGEKAAEPTPGTFNAVYNQTLKTACMNCHSPTGIGTAEGAQLDFTSQDLAFQTLRASFVTGDSSKDICAGVRIVAPGAPQNSYLLGVLIDSYHTNNFAGVSGCLPYATHLQDQNLSAAEQSSLIKWIQDGAQNN